MGIGRAGETHGKEVIDEFRAPHERVAVFEAQDCRDCGDLHMRSMMRLFSACQA